MTNKLMKATMALTVAGAVALPASQAAAASQTESALIGALLGGAAGAAVDGSTEAVALGALAGAALGAAVDNDDNRKRKYRNRYVYRDSRPYARDTRYRSYDRAAPYSYRNSGYYGRDRDYDRYDYGYRRW